MPINLSYIMLNDWVLGKTMCHIAYPIFALPVYVSSWTMMLISIERYRSTRPKQHKKGATGMSLKQVCGAGHMTGATRCLRVHLDRQTSAKIVYRCLFIGLPRLNHLAKIFSIQNYVIPRFFPFFFRLKNTSLERVKHV